MTHFRARTVVNDSITSEQCIAGELTQDTANTVLTIGNAWKSTVDLSVISNWLVTVLLHGAPVDGPAIAVKVFDGPDNFKVTTCNGGPYCTLQG